MFEILYILGWLVFAAVLCMLGYDVYRSNGMALTWKNVFLMGYAVFFGSGVALFASVDFGNPYYIPSSEALSKLAFWVPAFLLIFLGAYAVGKRFWFVNKFIPNPDFPLSPVAIFIGVGICMALAIFTTAFGISNYLGLIFAQLRDGWLAGAVGLATYYLLAKKKNPVAWGLFFAVLPAAAILSTTGSIGRRSLISIIFVAAWVGYYYYFRYRSRTFRMAGVGAAAVGMIVLIAIYSGFRGQWDTLSGHDRISIIAHRFDQFKQAITNPRIDRGALFAMVATDPCIYTGYVFDQVPESMEPVPFHGVKYFASNPVPRKIWPDKPEGLGLILKDRLWVQFNVGPGIIGHGYYEFRHLGVAFYAVFFGIAIGMMDALIRVRQHFPLFMIAAGSSLGNVLALPRGETSLFCLLICAAFAACLGTFWAMNKTLKRMLATYREVPHPAAAHLPTAPAQTPRPAPLDWDDYPDLAYEEPAASHRALGPASV